MPTYPSTQLLCIAVLAVLVAGCTANQPIEEQGSGAPVAAPSIALGPASNGTFLYATDAAGAVGLELAFKVVGEQMCYFVEGWYASSDVNGLLFQSELLDSEGRYAGGMSFGSGSLASASLPPLVESVEQGGAFGARYVPSERTFSGDYTYLGLLPNGEPDAWLYGASYYVGLSCPGQVVVNQLAPSVSGLGWTSDGMANGTGVGTIGPFVRVMGHDEGDLSGDRVVGRAWPGGYLVEPIMDELVLEGPEGQTMYDMASGSVQDLAGLPGHWAIQTSAVYLSPLGGGQRGILMGVAELEAAWTALEIPAEATSG